MPAGLEPPPVDGNPFSRSNTFPNGESARELTFTNNDKKEFNQ